MGRWRYGNCGGYYASVIVPWKVCSRILDWHQMERENVSDKVDSYGPYLHEHACFNLSISNMSPCITTILRGSQQHVVVYIELLMANHFSSNEVNKMWMKSVNHILAALCNFYVLH